MSSVLLVCHSSDPVRCSIFFGCKEKKERPGKAALNDISFNSREKGETTDYALLRNALLRNEFFLPPAARGSF
jgi:hypothetical protein